MRTASFAEFAKIQGVSKPTVSQWKDEGRLVLIPVEGRKYPLVNVEASQRLIANTTDPARAENGKINNPNGGSLAVAQFLSDDQLTHKMKVARAHREESEALLAELTLKEKAGELVLASLVDQTIVSVAADIRLSLERLPAKTSSVLSEMTSRVEIEKYLMQSIDEALIDLAQNIRNKRNELIQQQDIEVEL